MEILRQVFIGGLVLFCAAWLAVIIIASKSIDK
jgi:hypothetical protein